MKRENKKRRFEFPVIKKNINDFLLIEEGKVSKKNVAKLGMSLAILSILFNPENASGGTHTSHSNSLFNTGTVGRGGHTSTTHASHGSHGSHGAAPCNW